MEQPEEQPLEQPEEQPTEQPTEQPLEQPVEQYVDLYWTIPREDLLELCANMALATVEGDCEPPIFPKLR